jgi:class 3 adenylate cyclase
VMSGYVVPPPGGDSAERLERFYAHARKEHEWFRGRCFEMQPGGFISTFDGPARAIRCGCGISAAAPRFGVDVRIGLHTGECDVRHDQVAGLAVGTAAQVAMHAGSGEVLVSRTVKDLVAGSGVRFEDRGEHALRGLQGDWRLYSVERMAHAAART